MTTQTLAVPMTYSGDFMPDGDGYAPQIVLTANRGRLENVTELNTEYLPFTAEEFKDFYNELISRIWDKNVNVDEIVCRYFKMYYGFDVAHWGTYGYSQGDWGESFLFFPEEWQETVGWSGDQTAKDEAHNDLCRWIWGDVYEVHTYDPESHTFELDFSVLYGYEQAKEHSDRVFDDADEFQTFKDEAEEWVASQPTALELAYKPILDTFPTAKLFVAQDGTEALVLLRNGSIISVEEDGFKELAKSPDWKPYEA